MSTPSELPELHVNEFSVERVGEEIIWPLVDFTWEDDWRKNAFIDPEGLRLPRRGVMPYDIEAKGRVPITDNVDAILRASCIAEPMIDDDGKLSEFSREVVLASLIVGLHVDGDPREDMFKRACHEANDLDDLDDTGEFMTVISTEFQFDGENVAQIQRRQQIIAPDGEVVWQPRLSVDPGNFEESAQIYTPATFSESDMDLIEAGVYVFRAPDAVLRALEQIREAPMQ